MARPDHVEEFREHLRDRFGKIPDVAEELIRVVPLRMAAKRLGIERLVLKGGDMRAFFVGDDNRAYYASNAFGRLLAYMQQNVRRTQLKEANGKRSMIVAGVAGVSEALRVLTEIESSEPL